MSPEQEGTLLDADFGEDDFSVKDQITKVEDLLKRLDLIKRDRMQVLKDLKEKARPPFPKCNEHNADSTRFIMMIYRPR